MRKSNSSSLHGSAMGGYNALSVEGQYFADARKHPTMTQKEEAECANEFRRTGNQRFREQLFRANLRFVISMALRYRRYGFPLMDLVQEGNLGLWRAVESFDPGRGFRLISYAVWWIRAYIQEYVLRNWSLVRMGTTQRQRRLFNQLLSSQHRLKAEIAAKDGDWHVVMGEKAGASTADVLDMERRIHGRDSSLDAPMQDSGGDGPAWVDRMASDADTESDCGNAEMAARARNAIKSALCCLEERERKIILMRHLTDDRPATLQSLAEELGVSKERVRQLEARALDKLRTRLGGNRFVPELFDDGHECYRDDEEEDRPKPESKWRNVMEKEVTAKSALQVVPKTKPQNDSVGDGLRMPISERAKKLFRALSGSTLEEKSFRLCNEVVVASGVKNYDVLVNLVARLVAAGFVVVVRGGENGRKIERVDWLVDPTSITEMPATAAHASKPPSAPVPEPAPISAPAETDLQEKRKYFSRSPAAIRFFEAADAKVGVEILRSGDNFRIWMAAKNENGVPTYIRNWENTGLITVRTAASPKGIRRRIVAITFIHDPRMFTGADKRSVPAEALAKPATAAPAPKPSAVPVPVPAHAPAKPSTVTKPAEASAPRKEHVTEQVDAGVLISGVIPHLHEAYRQTPDGGLKDMVGNTLATALESAAASVRNAH